MTEHYYSRRPSVGHNRQTISATIRGKSYTFVTDAGVFAKRGIDFGSRLLMETMELSEDARVLDVGCGYGPIGIVAANMAMKGFVTLIDVNERAVALAGENLRLNRIDNAEVLVSDLFEGVAGRTFTDIVTNPPVRAGKDVIYRLFEQAWEHLVPGGRLWVVIQKKQGAPSAFRRLEEIFARVEEAGKAKGYRVFRAVKEVGE